MLMFPALSGRSVIKTKSKYTSTNFLVKEFNLFIIFPGSNTITDSYVNTNPTVQNDLIAKMR